MYKKNNIVVQSNRLVEAYYDTDLTATEHKILRYAAGKVKDKPEEFPRVTFTVREFLDAGGISGDGYYSRFEKIADELSRKRIKIKTEKNIGWIPWLSALIYENGEVQLTFNNMIKEMLLDLEGQFTKYDYKHIGNMRSAYTIRLFELLKQYAPIGKRRVQLDVLRNMLGTESKYKQYGQFKLRVLKQAQKEMEEKGELTFEFNEIKQGRKVVEVEFIISSANKLVIKKKGKIGSSDIEVETFVKEGTYLLSNYGIEIPEKRLLKWSKYGIELLNKALKEIEGKDIGNYPAYIEKILSSSHENHQKKRDKVKTENSNYARLIMEFIEKNKTKEIVPEWFVKNNFISFVEDYIANEEVIEDLWSKNEEYIIKEVSLYLIK